MISSDALYELKKLAYQEEEGRSPVYGAGGPETIRAHKELMDAGYARIAQRMVKEFAELKFVVLLTDKGRNFLIQTGDYKPQNPHEAPPKHDG